MADQDFINPRFTYAVVGATTNTEKYGYTVLKDLARAHFHVVGVNPKYHEIDGIAVYPTLADVPGNVDVAVLVVPPEVGLSILPQVEEKGITRVWFQPGAESDALLAASESAGITTNSKGSCIMTVRRTLLA